MKGMKGYFYSNQDLLYSNQKKELLSLKNSIFENLFTDQEKINLNILGSNDTYFDKDAEEKIGNNKEILNLNSKSFSYNDNNLKNIGNI